jgi:predicted MFS family arabinose efflux permease
MPPGTGTEAFTWTTVAFLVGASAGSALAGPVVQAGGWQAGVVVAIALPAVGLALQVASGRGVWVEAQTDAAPIPAE